jgi:hypothetical protein
MVVSGERKKPILSMGTSAEAEISMEEVYIPTNKIPKIQHYFKIMSLPSF